MGDVSVRCAKCGKTVAISEFADPTKLTCSSCGEKLELPKSEVTRATPTVVRKRPPVATPAAGAPAAAKEEAPQPKGRAKRRRRDSTLIKIGQWRLSGYWMSWLLFVGLASFLLYLRYGGVLAKDVLVDCKNYGMTGLVLLYAVVVVEAFREDTFEGLLCFFVPPYVFFYLFAKSDSFALRALFGGFLLAFGFDLYGVLSVYIVAFVEAADRFIRQGGIDKG